MFEAVAGLVAEHAELEQRLAEPGLHADQGLAKKLNQRYAELSAILRTYREWQQLGDDIEAAKELASEDESFAGLGTPAAVSAAVAGPSRSVTDRLEPGGHVGLDAGLDHRLEGSVEDLVQVVGLVPGAVVGDPVLRVVVGPDPLGPVHRPYL